MRGLRFLRSGAAADEIDAPFDDAIGRKVVAEGTGTGSCACACEGREDECRLGVEVKKGTTRWQ